MTLCIQQIPVQTLRPAREFFFKPRRSEEHTPRDVPVAGFQKRRPSRGRLKLILIITEGKVGMAAMDGPLYGFLSANGFAPKENESPGGSCRAGAYGGGANPLPLGSDIQLLHGHSARFQFLLTGGEEKRGGRVCRFLCRSYSGRRCLARCDYITRMARIWFIYAAFTSLRRRNI